MANTADGKVEANKVLGMRIERPGNLVTDLLLLPDTPALLSAGALERSGFTSIWAHGYMPCLVEDKSDAIIVFDVSQNLPMIRKVGIFELVRTARRWKN